MSFSCVSPEPLTCQIFQASGWSAFEFDAFGYLHINRDALNFFLRMCFGLDKVNATFLCITKLLKDKKQGHSEIILVEETFIMSTLLVVLPRQLG